MKEIIKIPLFAIILFITISCVEDHVDPEIEYTIWNASNITFEKADGADPSEAKNQDRITDLVWITRGDKGQIYNIAKESIADQNISPIGTQWAIGTTDQIGQLSFNDFRSAVGEPKQVVGKNLVLHLIEDDIYLSVKFLSWSSGGQGGNKGGFSYTRSTSE